MVRFLSITTAGLTMFLRSCDIEEGSLVKLRNNVYRPAFYRLSSGVFYSIPMLNSSSIFLVVDISIDYSNPDYCDRDDEYYHVLFYCGGQFVRLTCAISEDSFFDLFVPIT